MLVEGIFSWNFFLLEHTKKAFLQYKLIINSVYISDKDKLVIYSGI